MLEAILNNMTAVTPIAIQANATSNATLGGVVNVSPFADGIEKWIAANTGLGPAAADILAAISIIVIFLILSEIAKHFVTDVAPHLVSKTESTLDDEILKAVKGPIQVVIIIVGIYLAFKTLNNLPAAIVYWLDRLASIALILIGAYFVSSLIGAVIQWYINDIAPHTESDLDDHLMPFLKKFSVAIVYIVAIVMVIGLFTPITPLIAGLGVFGVAIAFAAKETLANLFGAFAILTDRPYKVGDRLLLQGVGTGDVVDMGIRSTRVKTLDNRIVTIPNERLASGRIVNLSRPDTKVRLDLKVGIGYKSDTDLACSLMEKIASETPSVSKNPAPKAYVSELGDFAVTVTLLVWIDDYRDDLNVPDAIYRKILLTFKQEGIEIPYPVMTVMPKR